MFILRGYAKSNDVASHARIKEINILPKDCHVYESIAPLGGSTRGKSIGVLWHKGISGRNAEDVASASIAFIRSLEVIDTIVLWLDNCLAQGKNWYLYTALVAEVNKHAGNFCTIIIRYFEPGHTFMSADSFHHRIEKSIRKTGQLDNLMTLYRR